MNELQPDLFNIESSIQDSFEKSLTDISSLADCHYNRKDGNYTNVYMQDAFEDFKNGIKNRFIY